MKLVKGLAIFVFSSLVLNSCFSSSASTTVVNKNKSMLYNTTWKLVEDNEVVKGFNQADVSLTIDPNEFKVSGYAGCNNFNTTAELDNGSIKFGPIISTKILCPNSKTEQNYLSVLDDVNRYEIKGNELYFYKNNILLLKFKN